MFPSHNNPVSLQSLQTSPTQVLDKQLESYKHESPTQYYPSTPLSHDTQTSFTHDYVAHSVLDVQIDPEHKLDEPVAVQNVQMPLKHVDDRH
jgi:hypothetical protein